MVPVRRVARLGSGHTPSRKVDAYWENCTVPWLTLADVGQLRDGTVTTVAGTKELISELGIQNSSAEIHPAGTVAMSRTASIGFTCVLGVDMATSQDFATWTCGPLMEPRFLLWALRGTMPAILSRTQGSTHKTIYMPDIEEIAVPLAPTTDQRAIANFLDTETARIDALIAKKRALTSLLADKRWCAFETEAAAVGYEFPSSISWTAIRSSEAPEGWRVTKLSNCLVQLTNGYVGPTRDILRDAGVRYVQGLHLKNDRIDFDRRQFFVDQEWHDARPRTALRPGDVLIVQTGDIGKVAVVPEGFGPANCHALLIARPQTMVASSAYLGAYLQSRFGYYSLVQVATGALHPHLEFGIRDIPIVIPPLATQERIVEATNLAHTRIDSLVRRLGDQIALLQEHRQALITAAVTGELDIPGAD